MGKCNNRKFNHKRNIKAKLYLANEIYMTDNIMKLLEDGKASTINNTSYVLFELPINEEPLNLYDVIYELQQNKISTSISTSRKI